MLAWYIADPGKAEILTKPLRLRGKIPLATSVEV